MTHAKRLWERACKTFNTAKSVITTDPDSSTSRFYYAAFYAVSALFALEGKFFKKHSAVETTVHRDLVNAGRWTTELGRDYSFLLDARDTADYDNTVYVTESEAENAGQSALRILETVHNENPETFPANWKQP